MTHRDFRRLALALTGTIESSHMLHPDFRLNGKIFATLHPDLKSGMVKLTPDQQQRFIAADPKSFAPEAGAWGRAGCTRVHLVSIDEDTLGQALTLAWQNIAAKKNTTPSTKRKTSDRPQTKKS